ncbi:MAG: glycosyltransferase family 2 protein [Chthoniobacterales bacterium]|nr:glycosyltransferase family 2 protein [Chthoniobacterales bacterium]
MRPTSQPEPRVAAVVATFRRDRELDRLFGCLAASEVPVASVCLADNASAESTRQLCTSRGARWLPQSTNSGPGAAWNAALSSALEDPGITHLLVLDDDVTPPPQTLGRLLEALEVSRAGAAAPLLFDARNELWAFPEPREKSLRAAIRRVHTPEECLSALGVDPHPFCWATGACMLYRREVFAQGERFRDDFWMLGEDLEFSMRAAAVRGGVFTARATVPHLPPPQDPRSAATGHREKFLALLQNISFLAFHSPHSAHLRAYLPGNFRRYLRTEGFTPGTVWDGWRAFWHGAVAREPAGAASGVQIRARARQRMAGDKNS